MVDCGAEICAEVVEDAGESGGWRWERVGEEGDSEGGEEVDSGGSEVHGGDLEGGMRVCEKLMGGGGKLKCVRRRGMPNSRSSSRLENL